MTRILGKFIGGKVVLDGPVPEWREGSTIRLVNEEEYGNVTDDFDTLDQGDDPESIERWIAAWDQLPPSEWTAEDDARWKAAKAEDKAFELSKWEENAEKLKKRFE